MPDARTVSACVIIIGNEILSGRTHDANLPYLAKALNASAFGSWKRESCATRSAPSSRR